MNSLKCFFCVLCLFFITGETWAQSSLTDTTARYLLFKHINAWSMHDTETIDDIFNENAVYKDIAYEAEMHGREEIKAFLRETFQDTPDFTVKVVNWFSCGNMLTCEWVMLGTPTKDSPDTPATGKTYSVRGASVATIKDGKFERWTDYYDK